LISVVLVLILAGL